MSLSKAGPGRVLPILGAVLLLAACTGSGGDGDPIGPVLHANGKRGCPPAGSSVDDQNTLLQSLTTAIQGHDRAAFLKLAGAPAAERSMRMWWRNVSALGFTTGAVSPIDEASTNGRDALLLAIGVHNRLDPVDDGKAQVPATRYRVTTMHGGRGCKQVLISDWKPLSNAPWDSPKPLTVVKTAHTVVAGDATVAGQVRRVAHVAEKAANWNFTLFRVAHKSSYIEQRGFVTFVAANKREAATWLRPKDAPKPRGWAADPANADGYEFPMPGVQVWPSVKGHEVSGSPTGGSRIVITPHGARASDVNLEATLVHEYVHAIFRVDDVWSWGSGDPVAAATVEGAARWIEAMFHSNPSNARGTLRSLTLLQPVIESRPFTGRLPTDAQIYGDASSANYYYDVSASAFSYLAAAYGAGFAIQSIADAYLNGGGPFGGVVKSIKGGTTRFEDPAAVQRRWASWVRNGFPVPAPG